MEQIDANHVAGKRAVLAASTGGHLAQLVRLESQLDLAANPHWITFDHPQSRSLLDGQLVTYVPYIAPRDYRGLARAVPEIYKAMRSADFEVAISTGAAIALAALPVAKVLGRDAVYIESISRFDGPSMSGRVLSRVPRVRTYTQHQRWCGKNWEHRYSVLNDYSSAESTSEMSDTQSPRIFVTLGTISPYRFDALVDRLLEILPSTAILTWQTGATTRTELPGRVFETMSAADFKQEITNSDLIISHAGVGSAMQIMDLGKCPVLVPRRAERGEHVDDHQVQIARELAVAGLAVSLEVTEVEYNEILQSHRVSILS